VARPRALRASSRLDERAGPLPLVQRLVTVSVREGGSRLDHQQRGSVA